MTALIFRLRRKTAATAKRCAFLNLFFFFLCYIKFGSTIYREVILLRYGIYSVYDSKSETYTRPFYADNDGVARRFAYDVYVAVDSVMSHHPEDFNLFWLGEFDDCTGILSAGALRHVVAFTSFFSSVESDGGSD